MISWTISLLFTVGNRVISVFKSNQFWEPISGTSKPIQKIHPYDSFAPELLLIPKSVSVRALQRGKAVGCVYTYRQSFIIMNLLTWLWKMASPISVVWALAACRAKQSQWCSWSPRRACHVDLKSKDIWVTYKQYKFISNCSGGWRFKIRFSAWLGEGPISSHRLPTSHCPQMQKGPALRVSFVRALILFMKARPSTPNHLQSHHLPIISPWGLRFQNMNLGGTQIFRS